MRIGVLGTGVVGRTIGTKLVAVGQEVRMGSRTADSAAATAWATEAGAGASQGTFADAAAFGEVVFNCTSGMRSLDALHAAGAENLAGKVLIDVANPLDFSRGFPPSLTVCNTDSLGEQIQRAFPDTRVVKALNTVNCRVMVEPARVPGEHALPICGNDPDARRAVAGHLRAWFGWSEPTDLGDLTAARGMEAWLLLWVRLMGALGTPDFNIAISRAAPR